MSDVANSLSCLLVGEGSLLTECVKRLQASGIRVVAVISSNKELPDSVPAYPWIDSIAQFCEQFSFDYLFSINSPSVLPEALLVQAKRAAINLHDGPLPEYRGLNTPAWSILNDNAEHAVAWHLMTETVNGGDIIIESRFSIDEEETALSLNAKCYQHGLETFATLIDALVQNAIQATPQTSHGHYYHRYQRPKHLGFFDPACSVSENRKRFRALFAGPYGNALCLPKVLTNEGIAVITQMELIESDGAVGSLKPAQDGVILHCVDGAVLCTLQDLSCEPMKVPAQLLPVLDHELIASMAGDLGKMESYWLKQLARRQLTQCPYLRAGMVANDPWQSAMVSLPYQEIEKVLALVCAYFSKLSNEYVVMPLFTASQHFLAHECLYLTVETNNDHCFEDWHQATSAALVELEQHPWIPADLTHRLQCIANLFDSQKQMAVYFSKPEHFAAELNVVLDQNQLTLYARASVLAKPLVDIAREISSFAERIGEQPIAEISLIDSVQQSQLDTWNQTQADVPFNTIHEAIAAQISKDPERTALIFHDQQWSYQKLDEVSNQIAHGLIKNQVKPGDRVGLMVGRSLAMVACQVAILKAGACFVPMSPEYPKGRLQHMADDGGLACVIVDRDYGLNLPQTPQLSVSFLMASEQKQAPKINVSDSDLAYMIYTSGSTGKPKGVMIEHRQVTNFFVGMDGCIPMAENPTWLAVTSMSFDISILELLWTLTRGFTVVIYDGSDTAATPSYATNMAFGLYYWNVANDQKPGRDAYKLLLEGARFADANGFQSVWTPERHFGDFGGLYPNPAITSAAIATITDNISIRAGSCVLPLHHPVRVAEDWALIDNLSDGRVGLSVAPGWMPNDFVIRPENYDNAKQIMFDGIDQLRKLWRGEPVTFPGPKGDVDVVTLPRPVQPELPLWLTTAGNPDNFKRAGRMGTHLLTHLLGQTLEEVTEKIRLYRQEWRAAGHPGEGQVTLMLHTFVAETDEQAKLLAREPMKNYLKTALFLVEAAAWDFPAFRKMSEEQGKTLDEFFASITDEDMDALLDFAFERYYTTSGLFGSVDQCLAMVTKVKAAGVDEIACLVDYGIEAETVLKHLHFLNQVREQCNQIVANESYGLARLLEEHDITHLQCTPSMARLMLTDESISRGLDRVGTMLVGGEALPLELAHTLVNKVRGPLINMYGPTETTIWSTTKIIDRQTNRITIGGPIANTQTKVVDKNNNTLPIGVPGELLIGGRGVVRGYWQRPELTAERFIELSDGRYYRTGDLVRMGADGAIEYLGRTDFMMKIRGCTVELGEIESRLVAHHSVENAAVVAQQSAGEPRLVAFVTETYKGSVNVDELKVHLEKTLTDFMVPSSIHIIEAMPLTPNAKIDRNRLPDVSVKAVAVEHKVPSSGSEAIVIQIWSELLEREPATIGAQDNFFSIGGHSLLVVPMMSKLKDAFSKPLKLTDLFRYPTVSGLAAYLDKDNTNAEQEITSAAQKRAAARRARRKS